MAVEVDARLRGGNPEGKKRGKKGEKRKKPGGLATAAEVDARLYVARVRKVIERCKPYLRMCVCAYMRECVFACTRTCVCAYA